MTPIWPDIREPELHARFALSDEEFLATTEKVIGQVPARAYDEAVLERAFGYPWARPERSYVLTDGTVRVLDEVRAEERTSLLDRFMSGGGPRRRVGVLAFGSNGAPETLTQKFAHFPDVEDRTLLALAGQLNGFDVGAAAQPTLYGSMPATLFPSSGTSVRAAVLLVTPTQFTQLAWSELTYHLGWLATPFVADEPAFSLDGALVFISRFGAFCVDREPVALGSIPATNRSARALTQEQLLDAAAQLAMGPDAKAATLVQAVFADAAAAYRATAPVRNSARAFQSERFTPFPATD